MIKKLSLLLLVCVLFLGGAYSHVHAQDQGVQEEAIISFDSDIVVNTDNSVDVTETIVYTTDATEKHGIYRDIYPYSSQNRKMRIEDVSVVDEDGDPYQILITDSPSGDYRIRIGDPDATFTGEKTYVIRYRARRAVGQLADIDEIYWNATGNGWPMPIYQARASVTLPAGATASQSACYYGPKGSATRCESESASDSTYVFSTASALLPTEGLTVAVGFQKGIVSPYSGLDAVSNMYSPWLIAAILPLLTLILSLMNWYRKGRDAKGRGVIVPQYDAPDGMTPFEVAAIGNERVRFEYISAEIVYLATKGYLHIRRLDENMPDGTLADYELTQLKDASDLPNDFDQKLLNNLFDPESRFKVPNLQSFFNKDVLGKKKEPEMPLKTGGAHVVKLSELQNVFFTDGMMILKMVTDSLLSKGYYSHLGRIKSYGSRWVLIVAMAIILPLFLGVVLGNILFNGNWLPVTIGVLISVIIYGIVSQHSPAKTEKGALAKEYILGLKNYLQVAEKDRLEFHNAPEKSPEVFEKLLPYAMVLGAADIWAKEFEGIYTAPPSWYSDSSSSASFSAISLGNSLTNFSTASLNSLASSPPGSGGSGGGGSSGGGGGGGGGGSW